MIESVLELKEPAIRRGIKTIGIGKKGSKPLDPQLIQEILSDLRTDRVPAVARGAFWGALIRKGLTQEEMVLEEAFSPGIFQNPQRLMETLSPEAPDFVKDICVQLLEGKTLDQSTAHRLGWFLFSREPGDGARGLAASILRVRYETPEEYEGLLRSMEETIEEPFKEDVPGGNPILQLAEPFDGVDHSYLITPLIADYFQRLGYRAVHLVGENSGPKFGNNLLDIARALEADFLLRNRDLQNQRAAGYGRYINQNDLSSAVARWVKIRREIIKRPFLSTLEKFLNPVKADVLITSAFHPPYTEKMITIAERAGFPGMVVIRNGLEGTLSFALKRAVKIMCSTRQKDGSYLRHEFEFDPEKYLGLTIAMEEKLERPSILENVRLIEKFMAEGKTGNNLFDLRVQTTCAGLKLAVDWMKEH